MEMQFSLAGGRGWLTVREEGPRACFRAELHDDGRGLYKAYLRGACGRVTLGTLIPEGGTLRLRRTMSIGELRRQGAWPPTGAGAELAFSPRKNAPPVPEGWVREERPARRMADSILSHSAEGARGALFRRTDGGFQLAFPCRDGQEFPLTPLFCLAQMERLGGREYAVYEFDADGCPQLPHKEGPQGGS